MMHISRNNIYYTIQEKNEDDLSILTPVPYLPKSYKLRFNDWQHKYQYEIDDILELFNQFIFSLGTETHICHVDMSLIKNKFTNLLYNKSYNSDRTWIT